MSTIANKIQRIADTKAGIKTAIQNKGIAVNDSTPFGAYSSLINSINTVDDVVLKFYDYNGDLLYSYTKEEVNTLEELPAEPEHIGLICQGWNWSLDDIKTEINNNNVVNVGAMFTTDDDYTRYYISLEPADNKEIYIEYNVPSSTIVKIDWGDGFEEELTYSSSSNVRRTHTYESVGDYVIQIWSDKKISLGAYYSNNNIAGISNTSILKKVELGNTIGNLRTYAFYNCSSLNSVTIPNSVTYIGNYAFFYCSSINSITIPNSVTSIGENVFNACYSLNSVTIPNSVTYIGNYGFGGCYSLNSVTIPNSVTSIGNYVFTSCFSLNSITIPNSVNSIGEHAFNGCSSLTSIIIPKLVTSIKTGSFYDCYSLASVTIPDSVTSIGSNAFYRCHAIKRITIPNSVTSIGSSTFYGCDSLASVTIPDSVTSIGERAFYNCLALTSITIPDSVTSIGNYVFQYCSSLTSIIIPDSVTSIGSSVFYGCSSLTSIIIPDSVTSIGAEVFRGCSKLKFVSIPDVKLSYSSIFYDCSSLRYIDLTRMSYPVLTYNCSGSGSINSSASYKILVNDLLYDKWCNEKQWKSLESKFERGFEVTRIISKSFEAEDVRGNYDYTNIKVTYVVDGIDYFGNTVTNRIYTHADKVYIGQNKTSIPVKKTVKYTYMGIENTAEITQSEYVYNCIICKYNVTSTTSATSLFYNSSYTSYLTNYFDSMIIDDGDPVSFSKTYTFDTKGIHEVVFKVKDDASITSAYYMFYQCSSLIYADLSEYDMSGIVGSTSSSGYYAYTFYGCSNLKTLILPESNNYMGYQFLTYCQNLRTLIHRNPVAPNTSSNYVFTYNTDTSTGYYYRYCKNELWIPYESSGYTSGQWSSYLCSSSYGGFEICKEIIPSTCTELTATANDVYGQQTCTSITLNATVNGFDMVAGNVEGVSVSKTYDSEKFEQNTSRTDSINRSFEVNYGDKSTTVEFIQGPWADCIIAKYNITSNSSYNILDPNGNFNNLSYFDKMIIDGKQYSVSRTFIFDSTGEKEVIFIVAPETTITYLGYLFYNCTALTYLDLSCIDMSNLTSTSNSSSNSNRYMCNGCTGLKEIIYPESVKAMGYRGLYNCVNLNKITIKSLTAPSTSSNSFYYSSTSYSPGYNYRNSGVNKLYVPVNSTGYDSGNWSSYLYNTSYCGFTKEYLFEPRECISIDITTPEDLIGNYNTCQISYQAVVIGYDAVVGTDVSNVVSGTETIEIEYNTSTTESKIYNKSFTYMGYTVDYEITQGPWINREYTIDLNSQWRESTIVSNPDPALYDAVYESNYNYNKHSYAADMYINISNYDKFTIYIAASSENGCDMVYASSIDANDNYYTGISYGSSYTANSSNPVHTPSNYTKITYSNLNRGDHRIRIRYYKDGSVNTGYDRGFLIIPKQ